MKLLWWLLPKRQQSEHFMKLIGPRGIVCMAMYWLWRCQGSQAHMQQWIMSS